MLLALALFLAPLLTTQIACAMDNRAYEVLQDAQKGDQLRLEHRVVVTAIITSRNDKIIEPEEHVDILLAPKTVFTVFSLDQVLSTKRLYFKVDPPIETAGCKFDHASVTNTPDNPGMFLYSVKPCAAASVIDSVSYWRDCLVDKPFIV